MTAYYRPDGGERRCLWARESGAGTLFPSKQFAVHGITRFDGERAHLCSWPAFGNESMTRRHPVSHGELLSTGLEVQQTYCSSRECFKKAACLADGEL